MKLREQVKYLRKTRGLKQKQVAKLTGISFDMYTKFESGARNMNHVSLEKVMEALNGSLCVVPYRFEKEETEVKWENNEHGPNGVTRLDTVKEIRLNRKTCTCWIQKKLRGKIYILQGKRKPQERVLRRLYHLT
jgi:transcriptional regulator with XRE-family HTH domain